MTSARTAHPTAATADKYKLYTLAFQEPPVDVRFCREVFRQRVDRAAVSLREDFCGTAAVACEWVQSSEDHHAACIDIDPKPLAWCRENRLPTLPEPSRSRIELIQDDVLSLNIRLVDIILALNSSFCAFKERDQLLTYFRRCHDSLNDDGMLVLGLYAGPEAHITGIDEIPLEGFVAIWEQSEFNAVTNEATNRIHFRFTDDSTMRNAFVYDWRMWTLRELTDALRQSGFGEARVYSRSQVESGHGPIEECKTAQVSTHWDALVVGLK
jgi:hypothetical protein